MAVLSPFDEEDIESDAFKEDPMFAYTAVLDERNLSFDLYAPSPKSGEEDIPKEQGPLQIHPLRRSEACPVEICNQLLDTDDVDDGGEIAIHPLLPDSTADDSNSEEVAKSGPQEQTSNETETPEEQDLEEILPDGPETHQEISKAVAARFGKQDKPGNLQHQKKKKKKDPVKGAKPGDRKDLGTPPCSGCDLYRHDNTHCYYLHKQLRPKGWEATKGKEDREPTGEGLFCQSQ